MGICVFFPILENQLGSWIFFPLCQLALHTIPYNIYDSLYANKYKILNMLPDYSNNYVPILL